jgi:hypothetical protein
MKTSEKKVMELALKLNDINISHVVAAIDSLRNQDPFSGAVRLLANLYDGTNTDEIREHIRNFMNDLKDSSVREEVITEITGPHDQGTLTMLVSSCWQSGLDYSPWVSDLALVFCNSDFATALECFTVLEESSHALTPQKKKELIKILKESDNRKVPEKSALAGDLISTLT